MTNNLALGVFIGILIGLLIAVVLIIGAVVALLLLQRCVNIVLERSRRNDHRRMEKDRK